MFAIVYFDDGNFRLRYFNNVTRSESQIKESEVDINKLLKLDNWTMVNEEFPDPFINCCFISESKIFL